MPAPPKTVEAAAGKDLDTILIEEFAVQHISLKTMIMETWKELITPLERVVDAIVEKFAGTTETISAAMDLVHLDEKN